ncbi:MAG: SDR family oxidoreductase [Terrimonas sp.]|nr:SDR family oxidoreductase [Terrimonas sp.]
MTRLKNKVAVITGGNSGIGLATARAFVREGAKVVIFGRDQKTLDAAAAELGNHSIAVKGDVTRPADLDRLYSKTREVFGKVDILFANAGVALFAPFGQTDEQLFDTNMDVNVKGTFLTVQKAIPELNENASIILNTSVVNVKGFPGTSAYSASKAALRSLVRTLATELVGQKVRVNAVSPGPIDTPIYGRLGLPAEAVQEMSKGFESINPMKRFGHPDEVANTVLFFASEDASYITGSEIAVDGGLSHL